MTLFDFEGAKAFALHRLEELPPYLTYHNLAHTRDDVVPAAARLADKIGINREDRLLLLTAAYFHDIGYIYEDIRQPHEETGVAIVRECLLDFNYTFAQIEVVSGLIRATKMPQNPQTLLEQIIADADMDSLGREDFFTVADNLRAEMAIFGTHKTDEDWYRFEVNFLGNHQYFTQAARDLRDGGKARNLRILMQMLEPSLN